MYKFQDCIAEFKMYNFFNGWGIIIIFIIFFEPKMLFIKLYRFCSVPDIKGYMVNSFKHKLFLLRINLIFYIITIQSKICMIKYLSKLVRAVFYSFISLFI